MATPTSGISVAACIIGIVIIFLAGYLRTNLTLDREKKLDNSLYRKVNSNRIQSVDQVTLSEYVKVQTSEALLRGYVDEEHTLWAFDCLRDIGIAILVAGLVGMFFEWTGKREFFHEIMRNASVADNITRANASGFYDRRTRVGFEKLIAESSSIDILVSYSPTFKQEYVKELKEMLRQKGSRIRVLLPNPSNIVVLNDMVYRFKPNANKGSEPTDDDREIFSTKIKAARKAFEDLGSTNEQKSNIEIHYMDRTPLYTAYVFDREIVLTPYQHEYDNEFAFMCFRKPGWIYDYFRRDVDRLLKSSEECNEPPSDIVASES